MLPDGEVNRSAPLPPGVTSRAAARWACASAYVVGGWERSTGAAADVGAVQRS